MRFIVLLIVLIQLKGYNFQQSSYPRNYDQNYERNYDYNRDGPMQPYQMLHHHQPHNDYASGNSLPHNSYGPSVPLPQYVPRHEPSFQQVSPLNGYEDPAQTYRPSPVPLFDGGISPQQNYYTRPNNGYQLPASQPNQIKLPQNIAGYELVHSGELPEPHNFQENRPQGPHNIQQQMPQFINDVPIQPQNNYPTVQNYRRNSPTLLPPSPQFVNDLPLPSIHNEGIPSQSQYSQDFDIGRNHHHQVPQSSYGSVSVPMYSQSPSIHNEGYYDNGVQSHPHNQAPQSSYANVPAPLYSQAPVENSYASQQPHRSYAAEPLVIPPATIYLNDRNYSTTQLSNVQHVTHQNIPQSIPQNSFQNIPLQDDVPLPFNVPRDQPQISTYDDGHQNIPTHNPYHSIPSYVPQSYGLQDRQPSQIPTYISQQNHHREDLPQLEQPHRDYHPKDYSGESQNHQNEQHNNRDGYQVVNELGQNQRGFYSPRPRQQNGRVDEHGYQIINEGPVDHFVTVGTPKTEVITPRQRYPPHESETGRRPYRYSRRQFMGNYINHYQADKDDQTWLNSRPNVQQESMIKGTQAEELKEESQNVPQSKD